MRPFDLKSLYSFNFRGTKQYEVNVGNERKWGMVLSHPHFEVTLPVNFFNGRNNVRVQRQGRPFNFFARIGHGRG